MKHLHSARVFIAVAAIVQTLITICMGILRYANQDLPPQWFDLSQTGNALALLYLAIYLVSAIRLLVRRDCSVPGATGLAVCVIAAGILLAIRSSVPVHDLDIVYMVFGILQVVALGLVTALASRDETHLVVRSLQHTAIIAIFAFTGTIVYGIITPTDVPSTHRADAAVILGAAVWSHNRPSPVLRMRIAKANDLFRTKIISTIVCTGSNALGERPEAEVERAELMKLGVDPTAIITESKTNSTIAQVLFLRDSLQARGLHSFVIVSDHFHLQRALEMCRFNGLSVRGAASESLLPWALISWYRVRDAAAMLLYWMVGV